MFFCKNIEYKLSTLGTYLMSWGMNFNKIKQFIVTIRQIDYEMNIFITLFIKITF